MSYMIPKVPPAFHRHERRVEHVYTLGARVNLRLSNSDRTMLHNNGYLSFGYWENHSDTYPDAARRLLDYFMDQSGIATAERILNVACGFGTETFAFRERFKPQEIIGIDIAKIHTDVASAIAEKRGLAAHIRFFHGDAVNLDYPDGYFSHILGIEGLAHFWTREKFFHSAYRVLKAGGELILTDVILGPGFQQWNPLQRLIMYVARKAWMAPSENQIGESEYRAQLTRAGFDIAALHKLGDKVFPGYGRSFTRQVRNENRHMGLMLSTGFTLAAILLGYLYRWQWIEYVFVRAKKVETK